jgi:23S rRNA (guanosine2251-2'-O)-methyltransferase
MPKLKSKDLNRLSTTEYKTAVKMPLVLVLDNVRSLHNIGSVFRSADAFRVEKIHLCGITAQPPHREIEKTALGATASVDWKYFQNTADAISELRKEKYKIICLEQTDKSISLADFHVDKNMKYAFLFGNEMHGVDEEAVNTADLRIEIPQFGTKHSLNVAVTAGIVLWDFYLKFRT